MSDVNKEAT